jgi:hypothetical protein
MTLEKWVEFGWLVPHKSSRQELKDLLGIVDRDIEDARQDVISPDWRFGIAYNAALHRSALRRSALRRKPRQDQDRQGERQIRRGDVEGDRWSPASSSREERAWPEVPPRRLATIKEVKASGTRKCTSCAEIRPCGPLYESTPSRTILVKEGGVS